MGDAGEVGRELARVQAETKVKEEADAKAKGETKEETTEETTTEETTETTEQTTDETTTDETTETKEQTTEDPNALSVSQRVQDRIDALTERMIAKDKKIAELEARAPQARTETTETKVTKEQLLALLNDDTQKQYHAWAIDKLTDLKAEEQQKKSEQMSRMFSAQKDSYEKSKEEYPDMADTTSELWAKANEIYIKKHLANDPDGQYMAALLAAKELGIQGEAKVDITASTKKADKEITKKSLATVSKKSITTRADELTKLEKAATESGKFGTPEWNKYLLELERDRRAKKKQ